RKRGGVLVEIFQKHVKKALSEAELWMVCHDPVEGDGIRWFGKIPTPQLVGLYQQAWVFCSPSSYEGFGVPSLEAMACGTPVVASPNVGAMEVLGGGEYGLLSPDSTLPDDLVRMLTDKTLRDLYVRKGLDRVRYFSWENIVRKYEELYVQILSRLQKQREVR
ncbi:MAG: glycosyltransferase, partial [Candidatus Hadarchaeum sp.]